MLAVCNTYGQAPYQGMKTEIVKVISEFNALTIELDVLSTCKCLSVYFDSVIGYRTLEESDLWNFWNDYNLSQSWIYEVVSGGWFDLENTRSDFMSGKGNVDDYTEYLIIGVDWCVNVVSSKPPFIKVL